MKGKLNSPVDHRFPMRVQLAPETSKETKQLQALAKQEYHRAVARSDGKRRAARFLRFLAILPALGIPVFLFLNNGAMMLWCYLAMSAVLLLSVHVGRVKSWGVSINLQEEKRSE